nr:M23 family metallopeptidase [Lysobacter pythonis]
MQREMSGAAPVAPVAALPTPGGTGAARIVNEPAGIAMPAPPAATAGGPVARTPLETPPANAPTGLQVPVQGVSATQLSNTFDDARGQNRVHDAIDIMADAGTPVLAAADGKVVKLFESKQGGTTLYQFDPSGRYVYYYAHLQGYAPGIAEGSEVKRGEVIGQVGSSGNASPDAPHLHFAIGLLGPEGEWWDSTPINPYPLLGGK